MTPSVSVVMAVYNGERYLRQSVESMLGQSFADFEFIVVDDGSTDNTGTILGSTRDQRIVLIRNQQNIGLAASLNRGLARAQGRYVARMDADDIALPQRLQAQVSFMDQHPGIGLLGCCCWKIDAEGRLSGLYKVPLSELEIRWAVLLRNPFLHPAMMIRRQVLISNGLAYDESFPAAQDYDLWARALRYTRGANLAEPLLYYRVTTHSVTGTLKAAQFEAHDLIAFRTIRQQYPNLGFSLDEVSRLRALFVGGREFASPIESYWTALTGRYMSLFRAFAHRYSHDPGLRTLRRQVAQRVAHVVMHRPFQSGWVPVVVRAATMDICSPWYLIANIMRSVRHRFARLASHIRFA